ncbi:hypothetical protein CEV34_5623 [Brucella pseudogrignonensis]|jgi:hypothetical protein|uniref:Uncharacterized protein n=1 Tax=Brucella pseudogrignonensis TaxID=419475 RepID=A0A256G0C8_9HYPH|nr:hypothetical protein CEV34_5623 [Brucella pseudogrignonensis]
MMITMGDDAHQLCSICMALKMENRPAAQKRAQAVLSSPTTIV